MTSYGCPAPKYALIVESKLASPIVLMFWNQSLNTSSSSSSSVAYIGGQVNAAFPSALKRHTVRLSSQQWFFSSTSKYLFHQKVMLLCFVIALVWSAGGFYHCTLPVSGPNRNKGISGGDENSERRTCIVGMLSRVLWRKRYCESVFLCHSW